MTFDDRQCGSNELIVQCLINDLLIRIGMDACGYELQ